MLVSDPHFAAQLLSVTGDHLYFDDVGCMATFSLEHQLAANPSWVRASNGRWVSTALARFDQGAKTPMDYGFVFSPNGNLAWKDVQDAVVQGRVTAGEPR
jgi:hypothetical protein